MPIKGADYGYFPPSGGMEVTLEVSRRGKGLIQVNIDRVVRCSNGRDDAVNFVWDLDRVRIQGVQPARVPIGPDGSFATAFAEPEPDLHPFVIREEYSLSGRFIRRGRAVRLVIRIRQVGEGGTVCDTGDLHITAKRY